MRDSDPITRLTAARFDGPQALYTEAVRLLSERPALPDDLAELVARLRNSNAVENPVETDDAIAAAYAIEALKAKVARLSASEPQCAVVKPLAWVETWSGGDEDIPSWHAQNVLGLHVRFSFSGRLVNGNHILTHSEAPDAWVAKAKAAEESKYAARILSAITLRPEAEVRAEGMRIGAAREKMRALTKWLNEDEDNGELLMASLDGDTIETLRAILAAIPEVRK